MSDAVDDIGKRKEESNRMRDRMSDRIVLFTSYLFR